MCSYILVQVLGYLYLSIYYFLLNKGLTKVYTIGDIEQRSDNQYGIIVNKGIIISILLSLFVQMLFIDELSL